MALVFRVFGFGFALASVKRFTGGESGGLGLGF